MRVLTSEQTCIPRSQELLQLHMRTCTRCAPVLSRVHTHTRERDNACIHTYASNAHDRTGPACRHSLLTHPRLQLVAAGQNLQPLPCAASCKNPSCARATGHCKHKPSATHLRRVCCRVGCIVPHVHEHRHHVAVVRVDAIPPQLPRLDLLVVTRAVICRDDDLPGHVQQAARKRGGWSSYWAHGEGEDGTLLLAAVVGSTLQWHCSLLTQQHCSLFPQLFLIIYVPKAPAASCTRHKTLTLWHSWLGCSCWGASSCCCTFCCWQQRS